MVSLVAEARIKTTTTSILALKPIIISLSTTRQILHIQIVIPAIEIAGFLNYAFIRLQ